MAVLERSELQDSPLADLHAIADQLGLEGYRRLRKAELVDAILGGPDVDQTRPDASGADAETSDAAETEPDEQGQGRRGPRRRRSLRSRRSRDQESPEQERPDRESGADAGRADTGRADTGRADTGRADTGRADTGRADTGRADAGRADAGRTGAGRAGTEERARVAEGVVELLGNGSAFLRVDPPEASDEDVYISAAQVRRCELVSGDRVSGPVRTPRRSERYPSLVRVDAINDVPADQVSEGARYDERPVAYPSERLAFDGGDSTLEAIEWLTPFGRGSRVVIAGPARAGKTELLRRMLAALAGRDDLDVTLVLAGVRPEEIAEWSEGSTAPAAALSFAASADAQAQTVEQAVEIAKRTAARGADALVVIDTLDRLEPDAARKVLVAARNLRDGGSLTILATATRPLGGETTVIALDPELAGSAGPSLDLIHSGTLRAELLVGQEGAKAIAEARAAAFAQRGD